MARRVRNVQRLPGIALATLGLPMRGALRPAPTTAKRNGKNRLPAVALAVMLACASGLTPVQATAQNTATLMADQVFVDAAGRLIASGAVEVWQGSVRMTASQVVFDERRDLLEISGPITIDEGPQSLILADAAQISPDMRAGLISGARIVLQQQLQLTAASVVRDPSGISQLDQVVASSCPVCASNPNPLWEIRAERVTHDQNTDQLTFDRAQFRVAGVPVFYLPRLRMPGPGLDRSRGILRPVLRLSNALGLTVGLPYFIPFGDAHDLTLTPAASTAGMVSLGFRWRSARENGGFEIGGQITHDQLTADSLRGYGYMRALFALSNGFMLSADLINPSDRTYLETYDITDDSRISGHVTLERVRRDQMIRTRALAFHSLRATDVNDELPNRALQASLDQRIALDHTPVGGELRLQLGADGHFRRSGVDGVQGRDLAGAHAQLEWRRSEVLPGGVLATGALQTRIDHLRVKDDSAYPVPFNRSVAQAMIELRWPLAMTTAGGARHVIEPIVQVIESRNRGILGPNDDNRMPELDGGNLFALSRYSGRDAPDSGSRVNAGINWSRYDAAGWSSEFLLGRVWRRNAYAAFPHVQPLGIQRSDWLLAGRLRHGEGYSLAFQLLVDDASTISRAETNMAWSGRATTISTSYLYMPASAFEARPNTLSEWSVDVSRRFDSGWASSVGWEYDMASGEFAAARAGLEFSNACLMVDLSFARRFVTSTNPTASTRYELSVELLGIGGRAPTSAGQTCRT
ncbi:LPS-assembly protein LptD [Pararhodobacter oceanensis]|nr:LPS assembly protein LptD [Pararhodobacter oceanensis]